MLSEQIYRAVVAGKTYPISVAHVMSVSCANFCNRPFEAQLSPSVKGPTNQQMRVAPHDQGICREQLPSSKLHHSLN
jgi:hypothetical protein